MLKEPRKGEIAHLKHHSDPVTAIAEDTFFKKRQLLVFVNTKIGAESQAEKIAGKQNTSVELIALSEKALSVVGTPTKQCKRLARCLAKGIAFHHAGLHSKQREIIEEGFKEKKIKCICATPTLAIGVDTPAFRVIIRDLKRYGGNWGMTPIPVLEYEQMAGRAGRPGKDPWGEAICIAKQEHDIIDIKKHYIQGEPEEIYSKLAVEPVLRTYILSLVASGFIKDKPSLHAFFDTTFYAHQYGNTEKLRAILENMIEQLRKWEFLKGETTISEDFISASEITTSEKKLQATKIGQRVSELYLDPYTADHIIKGLKRSEQKTPTTFSYIHLCASTLEIRPYIKVKQSEIPLIEEKLALEEEHLLHITESHYTEAYETYLDTLKTTMLFEEWTKEASEETIMEKYNVRPGELHGKLALIDWLIYATIELAKIIKHKTQQTKLQKLRVRLKHGVKEELLPLLKLRSIGRIRARKLFKNNVKDIGGIQRIDATTLAQLIGKATTINLKEQVGQKIAPEDVIVKPKKRKGQKSILDY